MSVFRRYPQGVIATGEPGELAARAAHPAKLPRAFLSDGLELAACGPMFAYDSSAGRVRPLTAVRDRAAGVELASTEPGQGGSVYVLEGRAVWCDGAPPEAAAVAVQGYPAFVVAGRLAVSGEHDREAVARCAIGIDSNGKVVIAAARALSMVAFGDWLISAGVTHAAYLDGGSAAALVDRAGSLAFGGSRSVPSVVGFRSSSSSSSSFDPSPVLLALLAAAAWKRARGR